MTTEVVVTGTGSPRPVPHRAGPGVLIKTDGINLQFDAGRATSMRIKGAGVEIVDLTAIFLTHYHSDHLTGLQDLVLSHWTTDTRDEASTLDVVAPNGSTMRFCERMVGLWDHDLEVRSEHNHREPVPKANLIGFDTPSAPVEVWSRGDVRVLAGPVRHEPVVGAVGYRVETPDGVVVITGDTLVCDEVATLADGADVVVYEAMRFEAVDAGPPQLVFIKEYHADTRLIGVQMQELGVPNVMLTHLIPDPATPEQFAKFGEDVRQAGYTGNLIVCNDLDSITLG